MENHLDFIFLFFFCSSSYLLVFPQSLTSLWIDILPEEVPPTPKDDCPNIIYFPLLLRKILFYRPLQMYSPSLPTLKGCQFEPDKIFLLVCILMGIMVGKPSTKNKMLHPWSVKSTLYLFPWLKINVLRLENYEANGDWREEFFMTLSLENSTTLPFTIKFTL